jgi:hypothetical protein
MELKPFLKKHLVLVGLLLSIGLLLVAGFVYPGGSPKNIDAPGFSWTENYISNLLQPTALNGMDNKAKPYGIMGVVLLGLSSGLAFVRLARKVKSKKYSVVIKYLGILLILFSSLITIPSLHDMMVTWSSIATLLLLFYVTILLLQSKLQVLKSIAVGLLLVSYGAAYLYFFRTGLDYLPIVQKSIHILEIILILGLDYGSTQSDFDTVKS